MELYIILTALVRSVLSSRELGPAMRSITCPGKPVDSDSFNEKLWKFSQCF